jgi:hypothetical protein
MTTTLATTTHTTVRDAILHSATLLKRELTVCGRVVVLDLELGRMDISDAGAKLIVRLVVVVAEQQETDYDDDDDDAANKGHTTKVVVRVGDTVSVTGILKKEERRTFLQATGLPETIPAEEEY